MDWNDPKCSQMVLKVHLGQNAPKYPKRSKTLWSVQNNLTWSKTVQSGPEFSYGLARYFLGYPVYHRIHNVILINIHDTVASEFCLVPQLDIGNLTFQNGVTRDIVDPQWVALTALSTLHCSTLTTLSTLLNIDNTFNRVSTVHALQFSELQSRIRFTSHRWSSLPEIASISFAEYRQQIKLANLISLLQKEPPIISFYWCQCRSVRKAYWIFMKGLSLESFYLQSPGNIFSSSGDFWEVGNNGKAPSAVQRHKYTPNRCLNRLNIDPHYMGHKGVKIDLYFTTMSTKRTMVTNPITGT